MLPFLFRLLVPICSMAIPLLGIAARPAPVAFSGDRPITSAAELPTSCKGLLNCFVWGKREIARGIAYKDAFRRLSKKTPATLIIEAGEYWIDKPPFLSNFHGLHVVGNGEVHLKARPTNGKGFNTFLGYNASNRGELVIANIHFDGNWQVGDCVYAGSRRLRQDVKLFNVELYRCRHGLMGAAETRSDWPEREQDDTWLLDNVTCHASKSHCVYIDRSHRAVIRNSRFYDPGNRYHPLKVISWEIDIHDNEISNAMLDGSASRTTGNATLSLVSCQKGLLTDNKIVFRHDRGNRPGADGSGTHVVDFQPRRWLQGCDHPFPDDPQYWSADYWSVKDRFIKKIVSGNHFVLTAADEDRRPPLDIIVDQGTLPIDRKTGTSKFVAPLRRPPGWYERSRVLVMGNRFTGLDERDRICVSTYWGKRDPRDDWPMPIPTRVVGPDCMRNQDP